ncbi:MAG: hypothetical protein ABI977_24580 [Acidobacteriota bacterium]
MKNNLMNKWTAAFGILMITLTMASTSAIGQQKNNQERQDRMPVPTRTKLACTPTSLSSDVAAFVEITNNTGQTIPQGTLIYWETVNGLKGKATVNMGGGLKPNAMIKDSDPDWTKRGNCSAYYVKK